MKSLTALFETVADFGLLLAVLIILSWANGRNASVDDLAISTALLALYRVNRNSNG